MKSSINVILFGLACCLPALAYGEDGQAAAANATTDARLRDKCAAEAKSLQTPDEEFDAYVEVCIEDLKKQQAAPPGKRIKHQPMGRTAD